MLKNFTPIIKEEPTIFTEDIYLFTDPGKVLTGRYGKTEQKDILSLIDKRELSFIYDNMFFAGLHPLLLVNSTLGPIFVDDSLFGSYRLLIAIIPHFGKDETLAMVKEKLKSIVLPSPQMKEELEWNYNISFDKTHKEFIERLLSTHRGAYYYRTHGRINGEISVMMSEIAYDFSCFCGCELEFNTYGLGLYEMENNLCIDSYIFSLVSLLFFARNYSIDRRAKMDVFFTDMGIYFEFGFEIANEFRSLSLLQEAKVMKNFKFRASSRLFECDYYQNERAFAIRGYPWFKHPNSADIKEEKTEFIYNI